MKLESVSKSGSSVKAAQEKDWKWLLLLCTASTCRSREKRAAWQCCDERGARYPAGQWWNRGEPLSKDFLWINLGDVAAL